MLGTTFPKITNGTSSSICFYFTASSGKFTQGLSFLSCSNEVTELSPNGYWGSNNILSELKGSMHLLKIAKRVFSVNVFFLKEQVGTSCLSWKCYRKLEEQKTLGFHLQESYEWQCGFYVVAIHTMSSFCRKFSSAMCFFTQETGL